MELEGSAQGRSDAALLQEWSEQGILEALARRIAEYRRNPTLHRLTQHALDVDPVMGPVYRAAKKLDPRTERDWWKKWLVRAGMAPAEADQASRGRIHSRDTVLHEIMDLYHQAIRNRSWPGREIKLHGALRRRARRSFGSAKAAREAALRKLGLKRPRRARGLRDASAAEELLIRALSAKLARFLPLEKASGARPGVSFSSIASDLGLRGWRKPGHTALSIEQLIFASLEQDPEVLSRLVRLAVKRAVRHRRLRHGWCWSRWNPSSMKQPIWREEVEEILGVLEAAGVPPRDLADERFLKGLPRRIGGLLGGISPIGDTTWER
jgi:hypothetical protein